MMTSQLDNPFAEEQIAKIYRKYSNKYHTHQQAFKEFTRIIHLNERILEVGVGTGTFIQLLLSAGYPVRGVDESEEMLKRAPKKVRDLSARCDLLNYDPSTKYDVLVSHSGGVTFKKGKFETYYQSKETLEKAFQKIRELLNDDGRFLVNKAEHDSEIDLGEEARFTLQQEDKGDFRIYHYTFQQRDKKITRQQRRLALTPAEWQKISSPHFDWNFDNPSWIIGEIL